jgi:DNA methylase
MNGQSNEILSELRAANSAQGEAKAFIHVAGYTFKLGFDRITWLLSAERWRQCGFADIEAFADSIQFGPAMKAAAEKRKELAVLFKQADGKKPISNRIIAKTLNVDHQTINNDLRGEFSPSDKKTAQATSGGINANGENSPPTLPVGERGGALVAGRENRKARDQAANEARKQVIAEGPGSVDMRTGDFRAALADLRDVDAIITDPPYGQDYLPLMRDLAAFADRVLKPDGVLAVLYGQTWLPEAMALMTGFRPYRWTACYLTERVGYVSHARRVQTNWKPLLIYGEGPRFADVFRSEGKDGESKERHPWGQDYQAFGDIIERLTAPGATVVDPFAGGGTTLIAAKALGRHAIGAEIDANAMAFKIMDAA